MNNNKNEILKDFLKGGPLKTVDVVDCHSHLGPALYMQVPNSDPDGFVSELNALGVSMACVAHTVAMVSDWKTGNSLLMDAVKKFPDRIFGYAVFNPRYPDDMDEEMERCGKAGLRGLKIHPNFHDMPVNSPLYAKVFERSQSENRVILCHYEAGDCPKSGTKYYKQVVDRFPKAVYIMAHSLPNTSAVDLAVEYFGKQNNVYFCLANAFQPGVIEYARNKLGVERLLYGSDGCWGSMAIRLGLICVTDLPDIDKEKILGKNMREILKRCGADNGISI